MLPKCSTLVGGQCNVFGEELSSAVKLEFEWMLGLGSPRIVAEKSSIRPITCCPYSPSEEGYYPSPS
jgi:hypothetical protein